VYLIAASAAAFAMAMTGAAGPAAAQCMQSGSTVTCSGTVSGSPFGFGTGAEDGLTINVNPVSVTGTSLGIFVHDNNTISVATGASVSPTTQVGAGNTINVAPNALVNQGITLIGANNTINNSGTITTNLGRAIGGPQGLVEVVNNAAGGLIQAPNGQAIGGAATWTVNNSGTIIGSQPIAVNGSSLGVTVINNGTIQTASSQAIGVNLAPTFVMNSGTITGAQGIFVPANSTVLNAGTIEGTNGPAIGFTSGSNNTLTLTPTSVIVGNVISGFSGLPGAGGNTLQFTGPGNGTFDLSTIGDTQQYQGFGTFNVIGGVWTAVNTFAQTGGSGPSKPALR
jgi:hypothetical protein